MATRKIDTPNPNPRAEQGSTAPGGWPRWAIRLATAALAFHLAAILAGALAAPPASSLERDVAGLFGWYHGLVDQGYSYRYYAPSPPPTPVIRATLQFADGRPDQTVDIPTRGLVPRLRYQRQLALANHLANEAIRAEEVTGSMANSRWARSYARHLGAEHPGCRAVTLGVRYHLIPDPERVLELREQAGGVDLDAEEFFTPLKRIGEFPCDAS